MNYVNLLNIRRNRYLPFCIIILLLIIITYILMFIKVYDSLKLTGIYNSDLVLVNIPVKYSDTINNNKDIYIDNKKYKYIIEKYDVVEFDYQNNIAMQKVYIKLINKELKENEVINFTIPYNKEKIVTKIIKNLKE